MKNYGGGVAILLLSSLLLGGCNRYVDREAYERLQKELADAKKELVEARKKLDDSQQNVKPKYTTYQNGGRAWRFNPSSGDTCLLSTEVERTNNSKVRRESCECKDATASYLQSKNKSESYSAEKVMQLECGLAESRRAQ